MILMHLLYILYLSCHNLLDAYMSTPHVSIASLWQRACSKAP